MQIDKAELFLVRLPFATSQVVCDRVWSYCDTVYLRLESEGRSGWSEVAPGDAPLLTAESSSGVFALVRDFLLPQLMRERFITESKRLTEIYAPVKGNSYAKGLVDMAWWDLDARLKEEPLWKTFGFEKRPVEVGLVLDRNEDHDAFYAELDRICADKYRRLTLKFRPGWDVQAVSAVRAVGNPLLKLIVDPEGALSPDMHSDVLYRLEDFFLTMIEQPFDPIDFIVNAEIMQTLRTPLALDEAIASPLHAAIAEDLQCCQYFSMKPGRTGGHTPAREIVNTSSASGIGCYAGFDLQSPLAFRHTVAMAADPRMTFPADYYRWNGIFAESPVAPLEASLHTQKITGEDGTERDEEFQAVDLWDEPGIGCEPDLELLKKLTVAHAEFE